MPRGYLVTRTLTHVWEHHPHYPLQPGDLLFEATDGTFTKHGPGLGIVGLKLSEEQRASLEHVNVKLSGLGYCIEGRAA